MIRISALIFGVSFQLLCLTYLEIFANDSETVGSEIELKANSLSSEWNLNSLKSSSAAFVEASRAWRESENPGRSASCLREAAKIYQNLSNFVQAKELLESAISIDETHTDSAGLAISFGLLSLIERQQGHKSTSKVYLDKSLFFAGQANNAEAQAYAYFALGTYSYYFGDIDSSTSNYEKSLAFALQLDDHKFRFLVLSNLAFSYVRAGDPFGALSSMKLAVQEAEQGGYNRGKAIGSVGLGLIYIQMGHRQEALNLLDYADSLFPVDFEWLERGKLVSSIGAIYDDLGAYERALYYRKMGYDFYGLANYPYGQLASISNIARLEYRVGNRADSISNYKLALSQAYKMNDAFYVAVINEGLGDIAFEEDEFKKALKLYLNSAKFYNSINARLPRIDRSIGLALEKTGNLTGARTQFQKALLENRRTSDDIAMSQNLYDLARLDSLEGNASAALLNLRQSLQMSEQSMGSLSSQNLQKTYLSDIFDRYELYINLSVKSASPDSHKGQALAAAEMSRSRILLQHLLLAESGFTADASLDTIARDRALRVELNAKSDLLSAELRRGGSAEKASRVRGEIYGIEKQLETLTTELRQSSPVFFAVRNPEPFDVSDFQRRILNSDALVEFSLGTRESYVWIVSNESVDTFRLPSRREIESRIDRLRSLLQRREMRDGEALEDYQKRVEDAEVEYAAEARALSEELLGQVGDKLKGKRLIIVADGRLQYFPIGALPMPGSGSDDPILLTNEVVYSPSASALKLFKSENPTAKKPQKDLLVFADPVFSKNDDRLTGLDTANSGFVSTILGNFRSVKSLDELARLPESEKEAESISSEIGGFRSDIRSGFSANRNSALNTDITDYKILHFATHGLIDEKRPELSGILLSLYDQNGKRNDGGFIRLQDVYGLNLRSDLVVLSACDTGIGKEVRGEGVMSLTNAFLQAGSKTVVSSLWKVDDTATKELMSEFYRGMASDGLTVAAALRQAQIKLYNNPKFHSPFYWAAFTMQGDYDKVPQISTRFAKWTYLAAALCGVLLMFYLFRVARELRVRSH